MKSRFEWRFWLSLPAEFVTFWVLVVVDSRVLVHNGVHPSRLSPSWNPFTTIVIIYLSAEFVFKAQNEKYPIPLSKWSIDWTDRSIEMLILKYILSIELYVGMSSINLLLSKVIFSMLLNLMINLKAVWWMNRLFSRVFLLIGCE